VLWLKRLYRAPQGVNRRDATRFDSKILLNAKRKSSVEEHKKSTHMHTNLNPYIKHSLG